MQKAAMTAAGQKNFPFITVSSDDTIIKSKLIRFHAKIKRKECFIPIFSAAEPADAAGGRKLSGNMTQLGKFGKFAGICP